MNEHVVKRIFPLALALLAILSCVALSFSWFVIGDRVTDVGITVTKIDSEMWLLDGNDTNNNGIPDKLATGVTSITGGSETHDYYYTEAFDFTFIGKNYALAAAPAEITLSSTISAVYPTQTKTYKLILVNRSDTANAITFKFASATGITPAVSRLLATLSFRVGIVASDGLPVFSDYRLFASALVAEEGGTYGLSAFDVNEEAYTLPSSGNIDFWFQIRMASYPELASDASFAALGITQADYNALQGSAVTLPDFATYFEVVV